jgi:hypothetical protein
MADHITIAIDGAKTAHGNPHEAHMVAAIVDLEKRLRASKAGNATWSLEELAHAIKLYEAGVAHVFKAMLEANADTDATAPKMVIQTLMRLGALPWLGKEESGEGKEGTGEGKEETAEGKEETESHLGRKDVGIFTSYMCRTDANRANTAEQFETIWRQYNDILIHWDAHERVAHSQVRSAPHTLARRRAPSTLTRTPCTVEPAHICQAPRPPWHGPYPLTVPSPYYYTYLCLRYPLVRVRDRVFLV